MVVGVGLGVVMSVVADLSFFRGQESDSAQWPLASFRERRQLKQEGGQAHLRMLCFPRQLNPECSTVTWLVRPHLPQHLYVVGFLHWAVE